MKPTLKICFAASEAAPLAKTGGLADVASALPQQLQRLGHDVRLFLPLYSQIDTGGLDSHAVDFIRDVPVQMGWRTYTFTARTCKLPGTDLAIYLIDCPELFHRESLYTGDADEAQRFGLFSRAVIECCQRMSWSPDVFHCNDWHTATIPLLLRTIYEWDELFRASRTLLTIHNLGYQGVFPAEVVDELGLGPWRHLLDQDDLHAGRVSFLRTGLIYADVVSTVSPTYAREIQTQEFGMGLHELLRARRSTLFGILNGVDTTEWDPARDRLIRHTYSADDLAGKARNKAFLLDRLGLAPAPEAPLLGMISRLVHHKGIDLLFGVLPELLSRVDARLVVVGTGEARFEEFFTQTQQSFPDRVCYHRGYNNELAHMVEAASDLFLMPSRYEPCGLNQMFSLRYGTLPVVRRTGGLADSVRPIGGPDGMGTGFVFDEFSPAALLGALEQALHLYRNPPAWRQAMLAAMREDLSWQKQVGPYVDLYSWLAGNRA